jgi:hypothetical protein
MGLYVYVYELLLLIALGFAHPTRLHAFQEALADKQASATPPGSLGSSHLVVSSTLVIDIRGRERAHGAQHIASYIHMDDVALQGLGQPGRDVEADNDR